MAASPHPHVYLESMEESENAPKQSTKMWNSRMARSGGILHQELLACCTSCVPTDGYEQCQSLSRRLSLPNGLLRASIVNEEPPYAEPHVRWCERSKSEPPLRKTHFSPTRLYACPLSLEIQLPTILINLFEKKNCF